MNGPYALRAKLEHLLASKTLALPEPALRRLFGRPPRSPEGSELDVETHALLRLMSLARQPEMHQGGPELARLHMERSAPMAGPRGPFALSIRDSRIPGPAGDVKVRIYTPDAGALPRPVLVYLHGGGFCVGSIDTHDSLCRALAHEAEIVVVSVAYRLAPEHPFPAGLDDATAVTRWVLANAASLGGDPTRVAIGGDSAGGNLSAAVSLALKDETLAPALQLLLYPATDATRSLPSHRYFRDGYFLTEASIAWFLAQYVPDPEGHADPRVSPLFAEDLEGAPPAFVMTAGFDPLRDEGRAYAERLREAGVPVQFREYEGAIHGFLSMAGLLSVGRRALDEVVAVLRQRLHAPRATTDDAPEDLPVASSSTG